MLGRFAAILICVSIPFAAIALGVGNGKVPRQSGLGLHVLGADFERRALTDRTRYSGMLVVLTGGAVLAWWRTVRRANSAGSTVRFEEEEAPAIVGLGLHRDGFLSIDPPDGVVETQAYRLLRRYHHVSSAPIAQISNAMNIANIEKITRRARSTGIWSR